MELEKFQDLVRRDHEFKGYRQLSGGDTGECNVPGGVLCVLCSLHHVYTSGLSVEVLVGAVLYCVVSTRDLGQTHVRHGETQNVIVIE